MTKFDARGDREVRGPSAHHAEDCAGIAERRSHRTTTGADEPLRRPRAALDHPIMRGAVIGAVIGSVPIVAVLWCFVDPLVGQWSATNGIEWARLVSRLGRAEYWLIPAAAFFVVSWFAGRRSAARWSLLMIAAVAASGLVAVVAKVLVARPRPSWDPIDDGLSFSFPSGHATTIAAAATVLTLIRPRLWPLTAALVFAVAVARVCDHGHYTSDVVAGIVIGAVVALGCEWMFVRARPGAAREQ